MQDKTEVTRAGFGPRLAAFCVDRLLLWIALALIRVPAGVAALFGANGFVSRSFLFEYSALDVLCWALSAVYFVLLTYFTGSTLGKKLMRLRVENQDGSPLRFIDVLYRETVGRFLSGILYLGYLMVLVDAPKRAFHDWLCGTCVVYEDVSFRRRAEKPVPAYAVPGGYTQPGAADAPSAEALPAPEAEEPAPETPEALPAPEAEAPAPETAEAPVVGEFAAQGLREDAPAAEE